MTDMAEKLARTAIDALASHCDTTECTCNVDPDDLWYNPCWFHLNDAERRQARIDYVAEAIRADLGD